MSALLAWLVLTIVTARGLFAAPAGSAARRPRAGRRRPVIAGPAWRRSEFPTPQPRPPGLPDAPADTDMDVDARDPNAGPARHPGRRRGPIGPRDERGRAP